ncbi:MAG: hypothetical protein CM1200mP35_06540 [Chloroflexota bacterium]|nr:MAG: hypothetical protein CM1200mP35_06540 [Chloroflexota bacterium]
MTTTLTSLTLQTLYLNLFYYEDTGCEVSQACLNCPLPQCKYDDPARFQRHQRLIKDLKVLTAMRLEKT